MITTPMIVTIDPLPVEKLTAEMAVLDCGQWFRVVYVETDDTGRIHAVFAPGCGVGGADYAPGAEVWAYPDWQTMESLAMTLAETAGYPDPDLWRRSARADLDAAQSSGGQVLPEGADIMRAALRQLLVSEERHAATALANRDYWLEMAARTTQYTPDQTTAFSATAAEYAANLELRTGYVAQLRAELADLSGQVPEHA